MWCAGRLLLLVWSWVEGGAAEAEAEEADEAEYETRRVLHELTALHATRYYVALLKVIPSQVTAYLYHYLPLPTSTSSTLIYL